MIDHKLSFRNYCVLKASVMLMHRFMFILQTNWVNIFINTFEIISKIFTGKFYINVGREVYKEKGWLVIQACTEVSSSEQTAF